MILVDTSVWIDYFHAKASAEAVYLKKLLEKEEDLCICGIIVTEILQGIVSDKEHGSVRLSLSNLIFLPMTPEQYYLAADIYRSARAKGKTIRSTTDCLIAACAIAHGSPLLHNDRDYEVISKVSPLEIVEV